MEQDIYKQVEEARDFFDRLLDKINRICVKHRMYLTQFDQEAPCWTLRGVHPKGGKVNVFIYYMNNGNANIDVDWAKLDYENFKIYSKSKRVYSGKVNENNIEQLIEKGLKELLKMTDGDLSEESDCPEWKRYKNKEEWIKDYKLDLPPIE